MAQQGSSCKGLFEKRVSSDLMGLLTWGTLSRRPLRGEHQC